VKAPRRVRIYKGLGTRSEELPPHWDSRWRCPHCKAGVILTPKGLVRAHRMGGGSMRRGRDDIPCLGMGHKPLKDTSRKVKRPKKLSVPDGTVEP
jgi:hypothetical protein